MDKYEGLNEAMVRQFAPRPGRRPLLPVLSEKARARRELRADPAMLDEWIEALL